MFGKAEAKLLITAGDCVHPKIWNETLQATCMLVQNQEFVSSSVWQL